jgi:hypothetical protein
MPAKQITAVRTRRVKGVEEVTHLAEARRGGTLEWATMREVAEAIEQGARYFIQVGDESLLLSVHKRADGRKTVGVGIERGSSRLLSLPRGRG